MVNKQNGVKSSKGYSVDIETISSEETGTTSIKHVVNPRKHISEYTEILADPIVRACMKQYSNAFVQSEYIITHKTGSDKNINSKLFNKFKIYDFLRGLPNQAILYNTAVAEIRLKNYSNKGNVIKVPYELHLKNVPNIKPFLKANMQDVGGYIEEVANKKTVFVNSEIIWMNFDPVDTSLYGWFDIDNIYDITKTKWELMNMIKNALSNNDFAPYWHFEEKQDIPSMRRFKVELLKSKSNPKGDMVVDGNISKVYNYDKLSFLDSARLYIQELNLEICAAMGVNPVVIGMGEQSRSGAEIGVNNIFFNNVLKALQTKIEEEINYKLFPKLNINAEINFVPPALTSMTTRIEDAVKLKGIGVNNESIAKYLKTGVIDNSLIIEEEELVNNESGNSKVVANAQTNATSPSRASQKQLASDTKFGTQATTRDNQVVK